MKRIRTEKSQLTRNEEEPSPEANVDHNPSSNESEETLVIDDQDCFKQNPDERCMIHIGGEVYVVAKTYMNQLQIHIKQFTRYDNDSPSADEDF